MKLINNNHNIRKDGFMDMELRAKAKMYQGGMRFKNAYKKLLDKLDGDNQIILLNDYDGDEARLNKSSIGKLMSNAAVQKSVDNGFIREQHYAVVSDIEYLFKRSLKIFSHSDKHGNRDVIIHRFAVPLYFKDAIAYITVKESISHGKRVYTAELMEIKKLGGMLDEAIAPSHHIPTPSPMKHNGVLEVAEGNILTHFPAPGSLIENLEGVSDEVNASSHSAPSPSLSETGGGLEEAGGNTRYLFPHAVLAYIYNIRSLITKVNTYAKKNLALIFFLLPALLARPAADSRDPFPVGYLMMSQGAIVEAEGASGRQPWAGAAFYRDTLRWGASAAAAGYHGGGAAARYAFGGFGAFGAGPFGGGGALGPIVLKASLMQLDAMGIYYEQDASFSAGTSWRFLSFSLEAQGRRTGLRQSGSDIRTAASAGASLLAVSKRVSVAAVAEGLTVSSSGDIDADPVPTAALRVCTVRNRYGSQGVMIQVTPSGDAPVRFVLAQEYRVGKAFALSASIASNPTMIGFGITVDKSNICGTAAVVNHPFLGWSQGVGVDYGR